MHIHTLKVHISTQSILISTFRKGNSVCNFFSEELKDCHDLHFGINCIILYFYYCCLYIYIFWLLVTHRSHWIQWNHIVLWRNIPLVAKIKSVMIYSPSNCLKPVWVSLFCSTQNNVSWRMLVTKYLTVAHDLHYFFLHSMKVNG